MNEWIEIFRGGSQTDSKGRTVNGDDLIDKAVKSFNAQEHEPPVVVGHPKDNAPAYGWVESLKREGNALLARFKQVAPEFQEMVEAGRFKKRSASFYGDGRLRHVGFLGAMPPAVKGLADIQFEEGEEITFEFSGNLQSHKWATLGRVLRSFREWLIDKHDTDTADRIVGDFDIEFLNREPEKEAEEVPSFTEQEEPTMPEPKAKEEETNFSKEQVDRMLQEAREETRKEFQEAADDEKKRVDRLEQNFSERERKLARKEIDSALDDLKGKVTPAMMKTGLADFIEQLPDDTEHEFGEGEGVKKQSPRAYMLDFLKTLPTQVNFNELTGGDGPEPSNDSQKLIQDFQEKNPKATYKEAALAVSKQRPDLFK